MNELLSEANNILLISVKPRYSALMFAGEKRTELRRVKPRVGFGDIVLVYESSPTMAMVGYVVVDSLSQGSPDGLWKTIGHESGIRKCEFNQYFKGADTAYGINFSTIHRLSSPVTLPELRLSINHFKPPQSYHYISAENALLLCGEH